MGPGAPNCPSRPQALPLKVSGPIPQDQEGSSLPAVRPGSGPGLGDQQPDPRRSPTVRH